MCRLHGIKKPNKKELELILCSSVLGPLLAILALLVCLEDLTGWKVVSSWLDKLD
jgi:hypothetical protein